MNNRIWHILILNTNSNVFCFSAFVQAKTVGNNEFHLVFNASGPSNSWLYITSQGEGNQVIVEVSSRLFKQYKAWWRWNKILWSPSSWSWSGCRCCSSRDVEIRRREELGRLAEVKFCTTKHAHENSRLIYLPSSSRWGLFFARFAVLSRTWVLYACLFVFQSALKS